MRKILFACVLLVGTSSAGFADEYLETLHKKCSQGSMKACTEGYQVTCNAAINRARHPEKKVYFGKGLCGTFFLAEGMGLYENGDYMGSRRAFNRAIQEGNAKAQKAMGILCSNQPWVCNRPSPLGL